MQIEVMRDAERVSGFRVIPWDDIEQFYARLCNDGAVFVAPMLSLIRSIHEEGAAGALSAHTSMHDLVVTTAPVSPEPDWLRVSLLRDDKVRIDHQTPTGPGDAIERPQTDVLSLFWRFSIEKWGVRPARDYV